MAEPSITDWIQAAVTAALLLVAILQAFFACLQWRTYRGQEQIMKQQLLATDKQAEILKEQTEVTKYIRQQGYLDRYSKVYFCLSEAIDGAYELELDNIFSSDEFNVDECAEKFSQLVDKCKEARRDAELFCNMTIQYHVAEVNLEFLEMENVLWKLKGNKLFPNPGDEIDLKKKLWELVQKFEKNEPRKKHLEVFRPFTADKDIS